MNKTSGAIPGVIGNILLVVFAILCMSFLAVLSLSTWRSDARISEASAQSVSNFYTADYNAEMILSKLRSGQNPEGVTKEGNTYSYRCRINDSQSLLVCVEITEDGYSVLQWQAISSNEFVIDDSLPVWGGQ